MQGRGDQARLVLHGLGQLIDDLHIQMSKSPSIRSTERACRVSRLTKASIAPRTIRVAMFAIIRTSSGMGNCGCRLIDRPFGNVHRQVSHSLQIVVDLQHGGDPP
jgi:hypothetical protein